MLLWANPIACYWSNIFHHFFREILNFFIDIFGIGNYLQLGAGVKRIFPAFPLSSASLYLRAREIRTQNIFPFSKFPNMTYVYYSFAVLWSWQDSQRYCKLSTSNGSPPCEIGNTWSTSFPLTNSPRFRHISQRPFARRIAISRTFFQRGSA